MLQEILCIVVVLGEAPHDREKPGRLTPHERGEISLVERCRRRITLAHQSGVTTGGSLGVERAAARQPTMASAMAGVHGTTTCHMGTPRNRTSVAALWLQFSTNASTPGASTHETIHRATVPSRGLRNITRE